MAQPRITTLSPGTRRTFRIVGWLLLVPGLVMFAMPFLAVPLAMGSGQFGAVALSFAFAFPGFILIAIGGSLLNFGYMKSLAEIQATETSGAVEHSSAAMGRGLARGLKDSGLSLGGTAGAREVVKVKCRACGFLESEDARFCSRCSKPV